MDAVGVNDAADVEVIVALNEPAAALADAHPDVLGDAEGDAVSVATLDALLITLRVVLLHALAILVDCVETVANRDALNDGDAEGDTDGCAGDALVEDDLLPIGDEVSD